MNNLNIKNLSKNYGKVEALKNINVEIKPGMFGLLGPNGAGKTTLMRTITTLLDIDSGNINYGDLDWKKGNLVRQYIGYLPQNFSFYKHVRVEEALKHIALLKGITKDRDKKVKEVLEKFNLLDQKDKRICQLSGGMLRRVGISQAVLGNPPIIIIDEPTAGLDPQERINFRNFLLEIDKNVIVIISTHIVEDIEFTCNQVGILNKGTLLYNGDINTARKKVQGKVYEIVGIRKELSYIKEKTTVISNKVLEDGVKIRFIADKFYEGSIEVEPSLEDAYLYLVGNSHEK